MAASTVPQPQRLNESTSAATQLPVVTTERISSESGTTRIKLILKLRNRGENKLVEFDMTEDEKPDDIAAEMVEDMDLSSDLIKPISECIALVYWAQLKPPLRALPTTKHGPLKYRIDGKEYWIIVMNSNDSRELIEYDVEKDEYCVLTKQPERFELEQTDMVFISGNKDSHKLHLLSHSQNRCATLDLQNWEWNQHAITYVLDLTYYQGRRRKFDDNAVFTMDKGRVQCLEYDDTASKVKLSTIFGLRLKTKNEKMLKLLWVPSMKMLFIANIKSTSNICKCWNAGNGKKSDIDLSFSIKRHYSSTEYRKVWKESIPQHLVHCTGIHQEYY